ncbi:aminotransferase class I/II-fold pyridoxal phosphate-dependent enzyme [Marinicella gelatinilytica]|uniref:aminotransferase class I/II-fold pyridoxal phosphate-dependent enzyme n=1 Tax=Marinicella gelatinilytica TaxID=2996017 RepID=UPI002260D4E7|nr:8-amino-7-oxononanoate synthase [Marinicella gelatinilytica]MCX7545670.1 8-amino-7-oxononanoate synthase [Marinicella gelatinilytica]
MSRQSELNRLKKQNLFRRRSLRTSQAGRYVSINGEQLLNFNSNDYLGLANHPEVILAAHEAAVRFGFGATGSPLLSGYTSVHQELEFALAEFLGYPRCLLFSSGYLANLGIAGALLNRHDLFIQDKLNHASLLDAAQLAGAQLKRYPHLAHEKVEKHGQRFHEEHPKNTILWATEGVFSMDGDSPDLSATALSADMFNALLWVDDAHGIGVLGDKGGGIVEHQGLGQSQIPLLSGTFGKAFGSAGAFVVGDDELIETILQKARSYRFNTAMPTPVSAASLKALELIQSEPWRREKLLELIERLQQQCQEYGIADSLSDSETPIQPFILNTESAALETANYLKSRGIFAAAIRPPTVPKNQSRLRFTLHHALEIEDIDLLVQCLIRNY